ncbi:MAG TPA: pyridoxamine 5'-phosphate oxidase family protein [Acidimicrobiia bacterium]|nr:pyridoxamine 5'-phosphate oxidase family protein [Acidimicrobiia bacterium]
MNDLTAERCERLLSEATVGHLGIVSDGDPYVSPISYVMHEHSICIRTGPGRRVEAIRQNPRSCVEVSAFDDSTGDWESVIVWGNAEIVDDDRESREIVMAFLEKYRDVLGSPLNPSSFFSEPAVIIRIPIEQASGRSSGSYFSVRSRPGRL